MKTLWHEIILKYILKYIVVFSTMKMLYNHNTY
jgi:hypothetical protein